MHALVDPKRRSYKFRANAFHSLHGESERGQGVRPLKA